MNKAAENISTGTGGIAEPVQSAFSEAANNPKPGIALCLSGGGYRAMLFHAGVLWRLNEIGYLPKLNRISSVSGGSITSGVLALNWRRLKFDETGKAVNFEREIINPIKILASKTIDIPAVLKGIFWFGSSGDKIAGYYRKILFEGKTLQDIIGEETGKSPRFVFNATNVQSGVLWRFMKPYMWDYRVGKIENPTVELAVAVAASSAFPPFLSPVILKLDPNLFVKDSGTDLQTAEFRERVVLTDGGVYDNLGLETAWKHYQTILISDAGGGFAAEAVPAQDWLRHALRVLFTIDNQVRSLRTKQAVESYKHRIRTGAYWTINADAAQDYQVEKPLECHIPQPENLPESARGSKNSSRKFRKN